MTSRLLPDSTAERATSPVRAILQVMQEGLPPLATLRPPAAAQASETIPGEVLWAGWPELDTRFR